MMKLIGMFFGFVFLLLPLFVIAQSPNTGQYSPPPNTGQYSPPPNTGQYSGGVQGPTAGISYSVPNPLKAKSVAEFIEQVLKAVVVLGIPVAVLFIVFAGFKFVIAMGKPEALSEAKRNLGYTILGIGLFLAAWLIAQVIFNTVTRLGSGS